MQLLFCPSHNVSLRIQIPGGSNFNQNLHKVVYVSAMNFLKTFIRLEEFADVFIAKITIPNRGACSANSSYCRCDGIEVSFQEKRDDLL